MVTGRTPSADSPHAATARRLGAHLRALRVDQRLTREAVAAAAGISPVTLAKIEQERTAEPGLFTIVGVASALGTTVDAVLAAATALTVVSVGYEGLTLESFLEHILARDVRTVADVRLNAISRRPGFSKNRLRAGLADVGIDYIHFRELGNPQENREPFRTGHVEHGCRVYRQQIQNPDADRALTALRNLAQSHATAVLCVEREETSCHRQVVIDLVTKRPPCRAQPSGSQ
ncbi:DUF488 family protein [Frankia sp. CiP3]|uniref:DUF488 family protein, N3 subclade n=1 Tax=Frankia sp. CiP3 TaxID=2880971 RepID=UPI001EF6DA34|nr:DUF488 family protein [Frankia sp. CiP3]